MDIGGHRFFSKSDRVMNWWLNMLPVETKGDPDLVMLVRNRLSRIFYGRKFYSYPVRLDIATMRNLGVRRMVRIGFSYLFSRLSPVKPEKSLEDFFINRFGKELYHTFFKDYTEKVWGVPCSEIKPEWGAQRIKGLSVSKAVWHAIRSIFPHQRNISQKGTETSLIDHFLYPKLGPGQLWEEAARQVTEMGGEIRMKSNVVRIDSENRCVTGVWYRKEPGGEEEFEAGDYVLSSMPVQDLIRGMGAAVPESVLAVAEGLQYRDFITLGLLYKKMLVCRPDCLDGNRVPDNWIYIQEGDVKVGRIQVFNNWSPFMVKDADTVWLGLEYFCQEGDDLWVLPDEKLLEKGKTELGKMGFCSPDDFLDGTVVRMPKTYPAYFGTYDRFDVIRRFTDMFDNLFLLGRNGMHRYNNQDHSMLTAMTAVDLILEGNPSKDSVWAVNTEEEYHESSSK
jgi:protoporphyrinogen oxidase